jgi:hypothetical protein
LLIKKSGPIVRSFLYPGLSGSQIEKIPGIGRQIDAGFIDHLVQQTLGHQFGTVQA